MKTLKVINQILQNDTGDYRNGMVDEIARRAQVSPSTVRNVLRRRNVQMDVNTRIRVLETASRVAGEQLKRVNLIKRYHENN